MTPGAHGARGRSRLLPALVASCVVMTLLLLSMGEYVGLSHRIGHVAVSPTRGAGETWVVVGSDSRAERPPGADVYGSAAQVPGGRADVVLVVHKEDGKTSVLSLPRDLLVSPDRRTTIRLTLALQQPQMLVDALCHGLGIPTDHLLLIDMAGFVRMVDALGGVTVTLPHPVTDPYSGLHLTTEGTQRLDGVQALALVRSRHPSQLVDGTWVPETEVAGAEGRTRWAGRVFGAFMEQARRAELNPIRAQRLAWVGSGALSTDPATTLMDVIRIWPANTTITDVPADEVTGTFVANQTDATRDVLSAAGFAPGACR